MDHECHDQQSERVEPSEQADDKQRWQHGFRERCKMRGYGRIRVRDLGAEQVKLELFGEQQEGGFVDLGWKLSHFRMPEFQNGTLTAIRSASRVSDAGTMRSGALRLAMSPAMAFMSSPGA